MSGKQGALQIAATELHRLKITAKAPDNPAGAAGANGAAAAIISTQNNEIATLRVSLQQATQEHEGFKRLAEGSSSRLRTEADAARSEAEAAKSQAQAAQDALEKLDRDNRELQASLAAATAKLRETQAYAPNVLQPRSRSASPNRGFGDPPSTSAQPFSTADGRSQSAGTSGRSDADPGLQAKLEAALQLASSEGQRKKELEVRLGSCFVSQLTPGPSFSARLIFVSPPRGRASAAQPDPHNCSKYRTPPRQHALTPRLSPRRLRPACSAPWPSPRAR